MNKVVIACEGLSKSYHEKIIHIDVLEHVNFHVHTSEMVAVVGQSGSGKSTLLHLLGGLDQPTQGIVRWHGQPIAEHNQATLAALRNKTLGFVYQFHHLLPEFSALENVAMPLLIRRIPLRESRARAMHLLEQVGLCDRMQHRVAQLSGGERQRAALARALVTEPACLLADEPTGNLDTKTAEKVFDLIMKLQARLGTSIVMVTHDTHLAQRAHRIYQIENKRLSLI